jgi:replicative DNA helicase
MDRLPPNDSAAERAILSACLRDNFLVSEVVRLISASDFYSQANGKLFGGIVELVDRGKSADLVSLADWATTQKLIEDVGGLTYIAELWDAAPSAANVLHYAGIIRNYAMRRDTIFFAAELSGNAWDNSISGEQLIEDAEKAIFKLADRGVADEPVTLQQAIAEVYERLDRRRTSDGPTGVPSGLIDLDSLTCGFQSSELMIIAARPSVGKSALGLQFAAHAAIELAEPVLFISLEMSRIDLSERLICARSRTDSHRMRRGYLSADEMEKIVSAGEELMKAPLHIGDASGMSMMQIAATARRMKHRHGLRMIVIDYLQLIEPDRDERRANRQEQVSSISRRLKQLAREMSMPVIALAQLNRTVEDRSSGRPRLSDLRESGSLEQDADSVILMHRKTDDPAALKQEIDLIVAKHRSGPTADVHTMYIRNEMRFENFAAE